MTVIREERSLPSVRVRFLEVMDRYPEDEVHVTVNDKSLKVLTYRH